MADRAAERGELRRSRRARRAVRRRWRIGRDDAALMARRMECRLTADAVRARTKTVTRREAVSWGFLRVGDRLQLVDRLRVAGAELLALVEVTNVRLEPLFAVTPDEVLAEGFSHGDPDAFCRMWLETHGGESSAVLVRRIEWRYIDETAPN